MKDKKHLLHVCGSWLLAIAALVGTVLLYCLACYVRADLLIQLLLVAALFIQTVNLVFNIIHQVQRFYTYFRSKSEWEYVNNLTKMYIGEINSCMLTTALMYANQPDKNITTVMISFVKGIKTTMECIQENLKVLDTVAMSTDIFCERVATDVTGRFQEMREHETDAESSLGYTSAFLYCIALLLPSQFRKGEYRGEYKRLKEQIKNTYQDQPLQEDDPARILLEICKDTMGEYA